MSNIDSSLRDCLQWRNDAAPCIQDEIQSMLGDPWEDLGQAAPTTPPQAASLPKQDTAAAQSTLVTALPFVCHNCATSPPITQKYDKIGSYSLHRSAEDQWLPTQLVEPNRELEMASLRTAQVLDEYLDSVSSVETSVEELLLGQDDGHQRLAPDATTLDDMYQGIANARRTLAARSDAVKEARLEWMTIRQNIQQERSCGSGSVPEVEPSLDDDNNSEISASSEVPPVVEEYFRVAGEAFIEYERLTDLEYEYEQRIATQRCDCFRGQSSNNSMTDCEVTHKQKRQQLDIALAVRQSHLHAQKAACLAQGLDPECFRYRGVLTRR